MIVIKFGGTSVGSPEAINNAREILLREHRPKIVVCSAMSGVTDQLIELSNYIKQSNAVGAINLLKNLKIKHDKFIDELIGHKGLNKKAKKEVTNILNGLERLLSLKYKNEFYSTIITSGELLLTHIFSEFLRSKNMRNMLLKASEFMQIDDAANPNTVKVQKHLSKIIEANTKDDLFITQGFIYQKPDGMIGHLTRGGSDYSAVIIGSAINAEEVQIWTDVDGLLNNDPRYIKETYTVENIAYDEVAELAYFGAKILHPKTTYPLSEKKIPILLKNTFNYKGKGTLVSNTNTKGIKGVAAKDHMNLIIVESCSKKEPYAFLNEVLAVFNKYQVNIDITNVFRRSILIALNDHEGIDKIVSELSESYQVKLERRQAIISIVGNSILSNQKALALFNRLSCLDVKMIEYGASKNSVSLLVDQFNKVKILKIINNMLFKNKVPKRLANTA